MCTLVIGQDVLGKRTVAVAANRDENPSRPSDPPGVLCASPRVVGGRDGQAGGTWLAIREGVVAVAMLNRRPTPSAHVPDAPRSRGLLAIDVAALPLGGAPHSEWAERMIEAALAALRASAYAPFTLAAIGPWGSWLLVQDGREPAVLGPLIAGWHVVTHADLDDPSEPRTRSLLASLAGWTPAAREPLVEGLAGRLARHGDGAEPAVCIHSGPMPTVSASVLVLGESESHYLHAEGRPCATPFRDVTSLLAEPAAGVP